MTFLSRSGLAWTVMRASAQLLSHPRRAFARRGTDQHGRYCRPGVERRLYDGDASTMGDSLAGEQRPYDLSAFK